MRPRGFSLEEARRSRHQFPLRVLYDGDDTPTVVRRPEDFLDVPFLVLELQVRDD